MTNFQKYIPICHTCEFRQKECSGLCVCTINGIDISKNATAATCPKGKFTDESVQAEHKRREEFLARQKAAKERYKARVAAEAQAGHQETAHQEIPQQSRGLGDTIAKITHATRLDKVAKAYTAITGKDCGCKKRQEALNKLVPYENPSPSPE